MKFKFASIYHKFWVKNGINRIDMTFRSIIEPKRKLGLKWYKYWLFSIINYMVRCKQENG